MKILYGVQATGNGHITRARVMAPALANEEIDVDFLFSGREPEKLFNMEPFGDYQVCRGLTLITEDGRLKRWKSLTQNNLVQLIADIRRLDLSEYDLVISDFEPVSAWAAKLQKKPCIGIAHQYAFNYPLPGPNIGRIMMPLIHLFAPVEQAIGLHWHHFNAPILPPLIESQPYPLTEEEGVILVYLPFETKQKIRQWLSPYGDYQFHIFHDLAETEVEGHLHWHPLSREGFRKKQARCSGVIANCGFGLSSEVLQAGKKLLTKPISGQPEQVSNAAVLEYLGLAEVFEDLKPEQFHRWVESDGCKGIEYPEVAKELARWVKEGCRRSPRELAHQLWQGIELKPISL